jgi:hypothetical protein
MSADLGQAREGLVAEALVPHDLAHASAPSAGAVNALPWVLVREQRSMLARHGSMRAAPPGISICVLVAGLASVG